MRNPYDIGPIEPEMKSIACPNCGTEIFEDDEVYTSNGSIVGCEHCISSKPLYEAFDEE